MKYSLFLWLFLIVQMTYGQQQDGLTLRIDAYTNEVTYLRNGVRTVKPAVKDGENIYVVISEFNPYLMEASLDVKAVSYAQKSEALAGEVGAQSGSFGGIGKLFGGLNAGSGIKGALLNIPGSRGASAEVLQAKNEFLQLSNEMEITESRLHSSAKKLELFNTTVMSRKLAVEDLEKFKQNKLLRPSRIRQLALEEINHAFAKTPGEEISITDLVNQSMKKNEIQETMDTYNTSLEQYKNLAGRWQAMANKMSVLSNDDEDEQLEFMISKTDSLTKAMSAVQKKLIEPKVDSRMLDQYFSESSNTLSYLRRNYEEMQGDIFKYSFPPVQAGHDAMALTISLYARDEAGKMKQSKTYDQNVPVTGGWKISGSLGLSFSKMTSATYEYSIINDVIVQDRTDDFFPSLVSFAHISRKTLSQASFGGSFGIGFPLLSGAGLESLAFFGGPTLFLGRKQKFLFTAGVMGTRVKRLSGGMKAGDSFDGSINLLPLRSRYEAGLFIGISYDLLN